MSFLDKWRRCSKRLLCPICGRDHYCLVSSDGDGVLCTKVHSSKEYKGKDGSLVGWLHRADAAIMLPEPETRKVEPPKSPQELFEKAMKCKSAYNERNYPEYIAKELGVSIASLMRLDIGWDGRNYTFPMRDGFDKIIGIRLRNQLGKKCAVPGSRNGLFIPDGLGKPKDTLLVICEGPTDCAALLDIGFDAIGRASCNTGSDYLMQLLKPKRRQVVIMADNDIDTIQCRCCKRLSKATLWDEGNCPECKAADTFENKHTNPGIDGAKSLAERIVDACRWLKVIAPPVIGEDVRKWYKRGGANYAVIAAMIQNASVYRKQNESL